MRKFGIALQVVIVAILLAFSAAWWLWLFPAYLRWALR